MGFGKVKLENGLNNLEAIWSVLELDSAHSPLMVVILSGRQVGREMVASHEEERDAHCSRLSIGALCTSIGVDRPSLGLHGVELSWRRAGTVVKRSKIAPNGQSRATARDWFERLWRRLSALLGQASKSAT